MEKNIKNTKNELFLIQNSAQLFYFKQWKYFILTNPIPLQFFTVTDGMGYLSGNMTKYQRNIAHYK